MEKIFVDELVESLNRLENENDKNNYIVKNINIIKDYLDFNNKVALCNLLVDTTCKDKDGNIDFDYCAMHLLYVINVINLYSNIEIVFDDKDNSLVKQYDNLMRFGIVKYFFKIFEECDDKIEFDILLKKKIESFKMNNCSNESILRKAMNRAVDVFENLPDSMSLSKNIDL